MPIEIQWSQPPAAGRLTDEENKRLIALRIRADAMRLVEVAKAAGFVVRIGEMPGSQAMCAGAMNVDVWRQRGV